MNDSILIDENIRKGISFIAYICTFLLNKFYVS